MENGNASNAAPEVKVSVDPSIAFMRKKGNRAKPGPKEEEWVDETLHLGEDFENVFALSISEARLLVEAAENRRKQKGKKLRETEPLIKMITYMDTFARFRHQATVIQLESLVNRYPQLEPFEKAQLISLCCNSTEEARTLIPSLGKKKETDRDPDPKISEDELQELLQDIQTQLQFTEE